MFYAIADLHGCYDKYIKMLEKIHFSDDDILYILGDIVDRGESPMKIIQDVLNRKNVKCLLGNRDYKANLMLRHICYDENPFENKEFVEEFNLWLNCGGQTTYDDFVKLSECDQKSVLDFLDSLSTNEKLIVNGNTFLLSHTIPSKKIMLNSNAVSLTDYILGTPEYDVEYFKNIIIVTGHTPTCYISIDYTGRILSCNNHIAIDCGAFLGYNLGCICLDTFEEFYV